MQQPWSPSVVAAAVGRDGLPTRGGITGVAAISVSQLLSLSVICKRVPLVHLILQVKVSWLHTYRAQREALHAQ